MTNEKIRTFNLDDELDARLMAEAIRQDRPASYVIRTALDLYLEEQEALNRKYKPKVKRA